MFFPPRPGGAGLVAVKVCALAESFLTEPGGLASAADGVAEDLQYEMTAGVPLTPHASTVRTSQPFVAGRRLFNALPWIFVAW